MSFFYALLDHLRVFLFRADIKNNESLLCFRSFCGNKFYIWIVIYYFRRKNCHFNHCSVFPVEEDNHWQLEWRVFLENEVWVSVFLINCHSIAYLPSNLLEVVVVSIIIEHAIEASIKSVFIIIRLWQFYQFLFVGI